MALATGFIQIERLAEDELVTAIDAAFTAESAGIFAGVTLPYVFKGYDQTTANTIPHVSILCCKVEPSTQDLREMIYDVEIDIVIRSSMRKDKDKADINLYSSFIRYILADPNLAANLNAQSDGNAYVKTPSIASGDLTFQRMRIKPESAVSTLSTTKTNYEITHKMHCIISLDYSEV